MKINIYVQPGAKKSGYAGEYDGKVKLKVSAPPVEGAANEEVVRFFSKLLKVPRSSVRIVSGELSRHKTVEVDAEMDEAEVLRLLQS
jgi:uncharacterized protein (TIGR00251 family)